jgi:hypothetical protein
VNDPWYTMQDLMYSELTEPLATFHTFSALERWPAAHLWSQTLSVHRGRTQPTTSSLSALFPQMKSLVFDDTVASVWVTLGQQHRNLKS